MNVDTWAVVTATAFGPIAAVLISIWLEDRKERHRRRHWVFASLMGLRGATISAEHVRALNLVQVEFHREIDVIQAWKAFLALLETKPEGPEWGVKHRDLLYDLLGKMAQSLGINTAGVDIARGGYYPQAWVDRETRMDSTWCAAKKLSDLVLDPAFDAWLQRMRDADYAASFEAAVKKNARLPGGTSGPFVG